MTREETIRQLYLEGMDEELISAHLNWPLSGVKRVTSMIGLTQAQKERIAAERHAKIERRRDIEERLLSKNEIDPIEELQNGTDEV